MSKLLEPELAARQTFDEEKLMELIESIRLVGLIEPIVVQTEGKHFRVIAGHRRLVAVQALKMRTVLCVVRPRGAVADEAIKTHENAFREDLNAAEEAQYFGRLLEEKCGGDVDVLCDMVKSPRGYVEGRLILLQGDEKVLEALRAGVISLGVAGELNKVKDAARRLMYLDAAMQGGASIRMVRDWRVRGNAMDELQGEAPVIDTNAPPAPNSWPAQPTMQCFLCDSDEGAYEMELLFVHKSCRRVLLRQHEAREVAAPNER